MLYTNLKHIETVPEFKRTIAENSQVVIVCGRMGEFSIPVYRVLETLQTEYPTVKFFDMEFDNPEAKLVCDLFADIPEAKVPFLLFYENGELIFKSWGTKTKEEIENILPPNPPLAPPRRGIRNSNI
jgi:thioredoxin 1